MKKFIALFLALIMVLSLFAGCAKKEETPAVEEKPAVEETPATEEETPAEETSNWQEEHPTWLCEEKTTLTVTTFDTDAASVLPVSNDLEFWQFLEEYTNVHIEWDTVSSDYGEVIQARMAAGESMGDIVNTYNLTNANTGGQNGLFLEISELYQEYALNTQAYLAENNIDMDRHWINPDGTMYGISQIDNAQLNQIMVLWNTAWLEKLGLEVPETLDEFTEVLYAMKEGGDLNGNGEDDEVILTSVDTHMIYEVLYTAFGLDTYSGFSLDENGELFYAPASENMKAMYTYANQLFEDGILDPEIFNFSWDWDKISERAANERAGAMILWSSFAPVYGHLTQAGIEDPSSENYTLSKALKSEWNNNNPKIVANEKPVYGYAISAECENPELAMRWMDVLMADPTVLTFRTWGVEGEDYEIDANGEKQLIMPADGSAWNISHRGCGQICMPHIQTNDQLSNPDSIYPWYVEEYNAYLASGTIIASSVPSVSALSDEEREIIETYSTDIDDYSNEMRVKFISGEVDIEEGWEEYCATLEALGLNDFSVAYQSICDRLN